MHTKWTVAQAKRDFEIGYLTDFQLERFALNDGDSINSGSIVVVDATGENEIEPTDLTLESVAPGQIDGAGAVTFRPQGGADGIYWLRCVAETALSDVYVQTMGLKVKAT